MSKHYRTVYYIFGYFLLSLQIFTLGAAAQDAVLNVSVDPERRKVSVIVEYGTNAEGIFRRNIGFADTVAGRANLTGRIRGLEATDRRGGGLDFKEIAPGEFVSDLDVDAWSYGVDLSIEASGVSAHTSWLTGDTGVLMAEDLFPRMAPTEKRISARVIFELPEGWAVLTPASTADSRTFVTNDLREEVFALGSNWELRHSSMSRMGVTIGRTGEWHFSMSEAETAAEEILRELVAMFGRPPAENVLIIFAPFDVGLGYGRWEAETRGRVVTIASSDMAFRTQSIQRMHEQLRHELFHLWMPNAMALEGGYDWFYEGFALYQSLRLAVKLNRISFDDMLDTISRAYAIDSARQTRMPLTETTAHRWRGGLELYARGMVVAFKSDAAILRASRGRESVESLLRDIFRKHARPATPSNGNRAVMEAMRSRRELGPIVERWIAGSEPPDLRDAMEALGLEFASRGRGERLYVVQRPNSSQRNLLDKLGYNNWRKARKYQNAN
jgi:predicted metalloprotease with PDZ domain